MKSYEQQITIRCSAAQRDGLVRLSRVNGVRPSDVLRGLVTEVLAARYDGGKDPQETVDAVATALGLDPKVTTPADLIKLLQDAVSQLNQSGTDPMGESPDPAPAIPNPMTGNVGLRSLQHNESLILTDSEKVCLAGIVDPAAKTRYLDRRRQRRIDEIVKRVAKENH